MGAEVVQQPKTAVAVSEGDQVLAQQPDPMRGAVRRGQIGGKKGRKPVTAQRVAHRGAWPNPRDHVVVGESCHAQASNPIWDEYRLDILVARTREVGDYGCATTWRVAVDRSFRGADQRHR